MKKNNVFYYTLAFCVWLIYLYFTFNTPQRPNANTFGLSALQIDILRVTIAVPYLFIWLTALYSVLHLDSYGQTIKKSLDGKGILKISRGLLLLLVSLILTTFLSLIRTNNLDNQQIIAGATIISNYVYVLFALAAFYSIYSGGLDLLNNISAKKISISKISVSLIPIALFSIYYVYSVFTNPNRQTPYTTGAIASYYLPDILIILTIIIPSIIGWVYGVMGAIRLKQYKDQVKGVVYQKALHNLIMGVLFVIFGYIFVQVLQSIGTSKLLGIGLGGILAIVYFFLIIQVVGYIFIALGTKKLSTIETV